jgi:hypothetical protein
MANKKSTLTSKNPHEVKRPCLKAMKINNSYEKILKNLISQSQDSSA